ncbi:MAG: AGE family epimerase/isomerase [Opitutaceae bacterium]|nr:AGE family epimerase/isomerase [Opitutaceae bacterium]
MTCIDTKTPAALLREYEQELLQQIIPFWTRHGIDREHGGLLSGLDRDGSLIDTDKAVWLQGRAAWTFATLHDTVERNGEWLDASARCLQFIRKHCRSETGKLYFQVTREGRPLRMRRYFFSEAFAAMGGAVYAKAAGDQRAADEAVDYFKNYLRSLKPGGLAPKIEPQTRPVQGVASQMMLIVIAQELRAALGDVTVDGDTCSGWIGQAVDTIGRVFYKPELSALMEIVAADGSVIDHFDGRTLNPGHAIECAWFILHEARHRKDERMARLGLSILDCMWARGWDGEFGGLFSYTDLKGLPVQEYNADMKFWWPHNEAEIATLLAWRMTRDPKYAGWHRQVRAWSRKVFADPVHGEWFGYAHRDGAISTRLKGNMWKGPFHIPRMLLYCARLMRETVNETDSNIPKHHAAHPACSSETPA